MRLLSCRDEVSGQSGIGVLFRVALTSFFLVYEMVVVLRILGGESLSPCKVHDVYSRPIACRLSGRSHHLSRTAVFPEGFGRILVPLSCKGLARVVGGRVKR